MHTNSGPCTVKCLTKDIIKPPQSQHEKGCDNIQHQKEGFVSFAYNISLHSMICNINLYRDIR